ncbi:F-box protein At2g17036-like [Pistacia vera]|uniref:F-box protein At2g17036-like n=1 Tax=Pistacia vera TaxID=55513 RepID=UPI001263BA1E|nr:F-box protein At2g17036-like [Pistacia vera]
MKTTINNPDWSTLPDHLLAMIGKLLHARVEALRFRAVCHSFRTSLPLLQPSTLNIPDPFDSNNQLSLTRSTVYAIEPLHEISSTPLETSTWFVKVSELSSGSVRVEDIFYRFTDQNLSEMLPKSLNLLDYRLKEITTAYGLLQYPIFQKIVVSLDEFEIMTLFSGGKLGVYRKGDEEWTYIDFSVDGIFFEDIVYHMEKFYVLGSKGLTITVDSKSLDISQVAAPVPTANGFNKYLIKSLEDLFFVDKSEFDNCLEKGGSKSYPIHLNVLKLDEEKREWIRVTNSLDLKDSVVL